MIPLAVAEVEVLSSFTVFVRGSLRSHLQRGAPLWEEVSRLAARGRRLRFRHGGDLCWRTADADHAYFDHLDDGPGCARFELEIDEGPARVALEILDLKPVLGRERASHMRVCFGSNVLPADLVRLADWSLAHLPVHWGAAGLAFAQVSGPRATAYQQIAAAAKRRWGIQILDMSTLQWDAVDGMPGVNWLSLVGAEFASAKGSSLERIEHDALGSKRDGVFCRRGAQGLVLAAGARPIEGDINRDEDLGPYARVASLLQPMLLRQHTPLAGPFARPEVMSAWLRRLERPTDWMNRDIADRV